VGNPIWRLPGVLGYGVVFPLVGLMIGIVFKNAAASLGQDQHAGAREAQPPLCAIEHVADHDEVVFRELHASGV
jgi:hypothetical protein